MELKELGVWGRNPPADWIQEAAQRWAVLAKRAALVYMDLFRASPLPRVETEVLALVWENPDSAEPALLAGALRVSRQSMTGLLDKLERGGYLERTPHAADRRRKTIRLRKKGLAVVRGFAGGVIRREAALFGTRSERRPVRNPVRARGLGRPGYPRPPPLPRGTMARGASVRQSEQLTTNN